MNVLRPILELRCKTDDVLLSDELLYGWEVKTNGDNDRYASVKTYMYYGGYAEKSGLSENTYEYNGMITSGSAGAYPLPTFKSRLLFSLPMGSLVCVTGARKDGFSEISGVNGKHFFVHSSALSPLPEKASPEKAVRYAKKLLGTPYKWGGKTVWGIDCSGLVSLSCFMAGIPVYRDAVPDKSPCFERINGKTRAGDVVYLKGHVGMFTDEHTVIHSSWSGGGVILSDSSVFTESPEYICICRLKEEYYQKGIDFLRLP